MMHPHRPLASAAHGERGETLIELMATVVLMGVAIVALLTALFGVINTANQHRRVVRAGNEAVNLAEALRGLDYISCASTSSYTGPLTAAYTSTRSTTWKITSVKRLQNANAATPVWLSSGCSGNDAGAQQITLSVTAPGTPPVTRYLTIVKRNKVCPNSAPSDPEVC